MKADAAIPWSRAKQSLLRAISNANVSGRPFVIEDFNRRDVQFFAAEGFVEMSIRGPVVTPQGERKLRAEG